MTPARKGHPLVSSRSPGEDGLEVDRLAVAACATMPAAEQAALADLARAAWMLGEVW